MSFFKILIAKQAKFACSTTPVQQEAVKRKTEKQTKSSKREVSKV